MTKNEMWKQLKANVPNLTTQGANFTAAGVEKFFNQVWDIAHAEGLKNGKALAEMFGKPNTKSPADEIFKMLGGK